MLEALLQFDTDLFRWINGHHNTALDLEMWVISQHWCWAIILTTFFAVVTMRREPRRWWLVLLGIVLCFLLADQGSVHLFKDTFCRLRPCHALDDVRMFNTNCGGKYGFVSSHAANAFAIVTFIWLRYRKTCRIGVILMIAWALITSYSRAYLGKHYPSDIVCGALFGIVVGLVVWCVTNYFEKKLQKGETK